MELYNDYLAQKGWLSGLGNRRQPPGLFTEEGAEVQMGVGPGLSAPPSSLFWLQYGLPSLARSPVVQPTPWFQRVPGSRRMDRPLLKLMDHRLEF